MSILSVHATKGAVVKALMDRGIRVLYADYDGGLTEVCVERDDEVQAVADLRLHGFRVDTGRPHTGAYSDPTFAQAAQNILTRPHRRRRSRR